MKRFITFNKKDKRFIKMINQTEKGFELVILSDSVIKELLETINNCEEKNDEIYIVWQMKFKQTNFILYKKCTFSSPIDNFNSSKRTMEEKTTLCGKKIKVSCSGNSFYTNSYMYKNKEVKKTKVRYQDSNALIRMLKISELNVKCDE